MYNWLLSIFVLKNTAELLNNVYTEKETELNFAINFFSFQLFILLLYSYLYYILTGMSMSPIQGSSTQQCFRFY